MRPRKIKLSLPVRLFIAGCLLFLALSAAGGSYLFYLALARKAPYDPEEIPETEKIAKADRAEGRAWMEGTSFVRLSLTARDGTPLAGYYLAAPEPSRRTAVLVHGYGANAGLMANYAQFYREDGFNVFMPDNRSHGASGGRWIGMGWLDKDDLISWLPLLCEKIGSSGQILLHGVSMGASAILMMNSRELLPQVTCMIADCGYTSAWDEFLHQLKTMFGLPSFPLLFIASCEARLAAGYDFQEASALESVKNARVPIFFIHGDSDVFVPTAMAYELYEAASCERELWIVPGAQHAMAYYMDPPEYSRRVRRFYEKYISAGP